MLTESRPDLQYKKIKNLLSRYILVSSYRERTLAYRIISEINQALPSNDRGLEFPPVDIDDARNILAAFMKYIDKAPDSRETFEVIPIPFCHGLS